MKCSTGFPPPGEVRCFFHSINLLHLKRCVGNGDMTIAVLGPYVETIDARLGGGCDLRRCGVRGRDGVRDGIGHFATIVLVTLQFGQHGPVPDERIVIGIHGLGARLPCLSGLER